MYSTTDEHGIINNFANEPEMYYAEAPSAKQKRNYLLQGSVAVLLIAGVVATALVVS